MVTDLINLSPYAAGSEKLHSLGYSTIPLPPGSNGPKLPNWVRFCDALPSSEDRRRFSRLTAAGIGICTGFPVGDDLQLIAIDIDVDGDAFDRISSALPFSPMVKVGAKGATLFFLADRRIRSRAYSDANGNRLLDLKAKGGQVAVPPTVHPDIGRPYVWLSDPVPLAELPVLTLDHFTRMEEALELCGWSDPHATVIGGDGELAEVAGSELRYESDSVLGEMFVEANQRALRDLSCWVPRLGIYKWRRKRNGYEGIARWRPSTTGRSLEDRRRNLSITSMGIRDFGGIGYSPVALVAAALGISRMDALFMLRDWTGITAEADEHYDRVLVPFIEKVRRLQQAKALTLSAPRTVLQQEDGTLHDPETGEVLTVPVVEEDELPLELTRPPGVVGELVDWIVRTAEYPQPALALGAALAIVGTVAGRRDAGPTMSSTALYLLAIARSGYGKQHPQDQIVRALDSVEGVDLLGAPEAMSQTALIKQLVEQPLSLSVVDEIGDLFARINSKRAGTHDMGIAKVLKTVWGVRPSSSYSTPSWANARAVRVHAPSLSVYGASTPKQFFKSLSGTDVENGTLNRFLLLATDKKPARQRVDYDDQDVVPEGIAQKLNQLFRARGRNLGAQFSDRIAPHRIPFEDQAESAYFDFDTKVKELRDADENLGEFYARTTEIALRIATIVAIGRNIDAPSISLEDFQYGADLSMWSTRRFIRDAERHMAESDSARRWNKAIDLLTKAGGSMLMTDFTTKTKDLTGRERSDLIKSLEEADRFLITTEPRSDGRAGRVRRTIHLIQPT